MSEKAPIDREEANAKARKEEPGGSGGRALEIWQEQFDIAGERLRKLDRDDPNYIEKSNRLSEIINKMKANKPTP